LNDQKINNKNDWINLRLDYESNFEQLDNKSSTKAKSIEFMNTISEYKKLIVRLQDSIFSDIIKSYILRFLYDNLSIKNENLDFIKFLIYFASCENYYEYTKVYTFFKELDSYEKNQNLNIMKINIFNTLI